MSIPTASRPSAGETQPVEVTPPATITVHHKPRLLPPTTFDGPSESPVKVRINGDITIDWGNEGSRDLVFRIADDCPDALIEGFELTWGEDRHAPHAEESLGFAVACEADGQGRRRVLRLTLDSCLGELKYGLTLRQKGARHKIDPRICNQGDGMGDGCA